MATTTTTRRRSSSSGAKRSSGSTTRAKTTARQTSAKSNSNGGESNRSKSSSEKSAFDFKGGWLGAAAAGAAIAIAANLGRKLAMQGMSAAAGDWDDMLAAEHEATLALFDKILATDDSQTVKRAMMIKKLTHALDKHAHEEEHVVYPALRAANDTHDADLLEGEHGYVKTFLFELNEMEKGSPDFLPKVREFRDMISRHAKMEEEEVFPRLKEGLTDEQNAHITMLVNKEGFKMA
ncbi:hemerythrin domain-containing protein [Sphingomonas mesophila]|uniref:hemerythrin domain-containing protein n=1 Tax=Sphingomonas mesophila TaxID=2303576 RepID=UPI0013C37106|nr:hemerythrin domain-containing protein [Sphingomonas mesophila]